MRISKLSAAGVATAMLLAGQCAHADSGVASFATGSSAGTYQLTFTGDGTGGLSSVIFHATSGITGIKLDGLSFTDLGLGSFSLGQVNYIGNTHQLVVSGTGTFTGVVTWDSNTSFVGGPIAAVPEPANIAMLLAGLGALGAMSRRRRSN